MALRQVQPRGVVYTVFTYDGTPASIDEFNAYASQDGGACAAQFLDVDTFRFENPSYQPGVFYNRPITDVIVMGKIQGQGPTVAENVDAAYVEHYYEDVP